MKVLDKDISAEKYPGGASKNKQLSSTMFSSRTGSVSIQQEVQQHIYKMNRQKSRLASNM